MAACVIAFSGKVPREAVLIKSASIAMSRRGFFMVRVGGSGER